MKKTILPVMIFVSLATMGQEPVEKKTPNHVTAAFSRLYPGVKDVKWDREKGNYEANFTKDGRKMAVLMNAEGKLLETETGIPATELPAKASAYMQQNYKGKKIKETAKILLADGTLEYEAALGKKDVLFDKDGNFLKVAAD